MGFKNAGFPHYAFNPLGFRLGAGAGLPFNNLMFRDILVRDQFMEDTIGDFQAPEDHDYRNAHLIGDGTTAIYFYAGLDGETVYFYNIGTSSWVSQTYNHSTGVVFGAGVEILEAYSDLGDVWTFEEKGCTALYNLKGTDHGYIDASGTALENFRTGRNFLASQWPTAIRLKNNNAYGYSGSVGVTGATTGYRFTEPVPIDVDFTMTYGTLTSPIIYDYANTESDGSGDGYGFRINTDYTADFYRKDTGVITLLASATAGDYEGGIRVVMNYNIPNDKFTLKAYELGSVNPSDTDNVIDPTHAYPENDYQRFEFPNGNEVIALITDGTPEDLNLWTITGSVCVAYIPSAFTFDESLPPVITGFVYDEVGNRLDALGGLLEYVGAIKLNASFTGSNAFQSNGTDNYVDTGVVPVDSADWVWRYYGDFPSISGANRYIGSADGGRMYFGVNLAGNWAFNYKDDISALSDTADSDAHLFEITGNGKFYIDGNLVSDKSGATGTVPVGNLYLLSLGGVVNFVDSTLYYTEFKNNSSIIKRIVASAGIGDQLYDTDGNEYQIEGTINEGTQWVEQDEYHYNMVNGFDKYTNSAGEFLYVPIGATVSQAGWSLLESFPQDGKSLLPCETKISFPQAPALIQADVDNVLFDVSGNPREIAWEDVINATAEQEVIGIESTVGNDGQGQVVLPGLTVAYQEYTADVPNGGTLVFSSVSGDNYYDSLNGVIVVGTGSNITLTNNTGDTADMGVIHMTGQIETATVAQMTAISAEMVSGTDLQHLKNPILQAIGKNIFDGNLEIGSISSTTGEPTPSPLTTRSVNFLKVKSSAAYTINPLSFDSGDLNRVYYYDSNENFISFDGLNSVGESTFTTPNNCKKIKFRYGDTAEQTVQIELGLSATAYEPFKLSQMSILSSGGADWIGRSLPNGVSDLSIPYLRKNVQNVQSYVLTEDDVVSFSTFTNATFAQTKTPLLTDNFTWADSVEGKVKFANFLETIGGKAAGDWLPYEFATRATGRMDVGLPLTITNITEARAFLAGRTIYYQLAAPIITDAQISIVDENGVSQDYWHLYANGQISGEAEDLLPIVQYKNLQHGDQIMADTHYGYKKQRLVGYAEALTGNDLTRAYRALNK